MNRNESTRNESFHLLTRRDEGDMESVALLLEALGVEYHLDEQATGLWIAGGREAEVSEQLQLYREENRDWPPVAIPPAPHPLMPPTVLVMGGMAVFYLITGEWKTGSIWFDRGIVDAQAVRAGEGWRLVTGLTLHADFRHLLGNCCLGGVLVHLLSRSVGYGLAWALLIGCGTLGNWCNVIARRSVHFSVGFSTSIFAALGLLSGMQVLRRGKSMWKDLLLSFGAGLALLALLGAEGEQTDIGAHFFGFLVGIAGGVLLGGIPLRRWFGPPYRQRVLFVLSVAVVVVSWWRALA